MTRRFIVGMVALVVCATTTMARAEDGELAGVVELCSMNTPAQFASIQAELDELRAQVRQISYGDETVGCSDCGTVSCDDCCSTCDSCCGSGCGCGCGLTGGGIYGGIEAVIVRPCFGHEIDKLGIDGPVLPFDPRYDFAASPRIFVGWVNACGTGLRARYWYFDQQAVLQNTRIAQPVGGDGFIGRGLPTSGLRAQVFDIEFTKLVHWNCVTSNLTMGVRYGGVQNSLRNFESLGGDGLDIGGAGLRTTFDGWGPTIAMENRIPIGRTNLSAVGNLRGALLYGEMIYGVVGDGEYTISEGQDDVVAVAELQVGMEWKRCTRFGLVSLYGLFEGQWWGGAVGNLALDSLTFPIGGLVRGYSTNSDLGFVGGTVGISLAR